MPNIGVVIGQFLSLSGNGIGNLRPAIACIHTIKPGKSIQELLTLPIFNIDPAGGLDHSVWRVPPRMVRQMGRRVKKILAVPLIELIVFQHSLRPYLYRVSPPNLFSL